MNTGLEYTLVYSKTQSTKYNPVFVKVVMNVLRLVIGKVLE